MSRRRLRRRNEKAQRHAPPASRPVPASPTIREATRVERLAYTRPQAAEALGISRTTFNRRVLPLVETVEMPWGTLLVPVDELQRLLAEQRQPARRRKDEAISGRPVALAPEIANRICAERAAGMTLAQIARELNTAETPTAHGGAQWWPSTVRAVITRTHA